MALTFRPISITDGNDYEKYLKFTDRKASDYSFANLWGWSREYGLEWAWEEQPELIWIRQKEPEAAYWAPVGQWQQPDWAEILENRFSPGTVFVRIPETLPDIWKSALGTRILYEPAEALHDYVYSVPDLISLKGNRFHKKKNLLNQFVNQYAYTYMPMGPERVREALSMQEAWCVWRDCESAEILAAENRVISRVLENWDSFENLLGGAIYCDGKMAAFTVGEELNPETLLIHFEKALPDYKGIYQAINRMFLQAHDRFLFVNREQDMGEPGLRKAKQSYNPVGFVRKYRVTFLK
ncbi:MAG: DUF2156 domain-containing protein [Desulfococcaceae bacterium]